MTTEDHSPQAVVRFRRRPDVVDLFFLPGAAFALFVLTPLVALLRRALGDGGIVRAAGTATVREALVLSLLTSTVTLLVVLVAGTPLAYGLARWRFPGKQLLDTLVDLPLVLPPVVAGLALLMAFGRRGVFGGGLRAAGIELAFTPWAVVIAQVFVSAPFYIRAARAGFQSVDLALEQVAYTLGVSRLVVFRRISLPLALPAIAGGAVLCWARALSEFGATMLFAGNLRGRTQTMPLAILSAMESDLSVALALAAILLGVAAAILLAVRLLGRAGDRF